MALIYDKATYDSLYSAPAWPHGIRGMPKTPRHHYNWFVQKLFVDRNAGVLSGGPGWAQLSDVAIIGGGFGWTAEKLLEFKPTINIINIETSPHVINNLAVSEEADIRQYLIDDGFDPDDLSFLMHPDQTRTLTANEVWQYWLRPDGVRSSITTLDNDLSTNGQRRAVRTTLGGNVDALITENVLDGFEAEVEIDNFLDFVQQTRPNPACTVVHLVGAVSEAATAPFIEKPGADWKAYLTARGFGNHYILDTAGRLF